MAVFCTKLTHTVHVLSTVYTVLNTHTRVAADNLIRKTIQTKTKFEIRHPGSPGTGEASSIACRIPSRYIRPGMLGLMMTCLPPQPPPQKTQLS